MRNLIVTIIFLLFASTVFSQTALESLREEGNFSKLYLQAKQNLETVSNKKDSLENYYYKILGLKTLGFKEHARVELNNIDYLISNSSSNDSLVQNVLRLNQLVYQDEGKMDSAYVVYKKLDSLQYFQEKQLYKKIDSLGFRNEFEEQFDITSKLDALYHSNINLSTKDKQYYLQTKLSTYNKWKDSESANLFLKNYESICREDYKEKPIRLARSLNSIASQYTHNLANPLQSDTLIKESIAIFKQHVDSMDLLLFYPYHLISEVKYNLGQRKKSINLEQQVVDIILKYNLQESNVYASALNNLGAYFNRMGKIEKSILYSEESIEIQKRMGLDNDVNYLASLNNLGVAKKMAGDLNGATEIYASVLTKLIALLGMNDINVAVVSANLGRIYNELGDYSRAHTLIDSSINIFKTLNLTQSNSYPKLLYAKCETYLYDADYENAYQLCKEAEQQHVAQIGTSNDFYGNLQNNLAEALSGMGRHTEAIKIIEKGKENIIQTIGEYNYDLANVNNNLSNYYISQGNPEASLKYCLMAKKIQDSIMSEFHFQKNKTNVDLIYDYHMLDQKDEMINSFQNYCKVYEYQVLNIVEGFSERKTIRFIQKNQGQIDGSIATILNSQVDINKFQNEIFLLNTLTRNLAFKIHRQDQFEKLAKENDQLKEQLAEWKSTRKKIDKEAFVKESEANLDSLFTSLEKIESSFLEYTQLDFKKINYSITEVSNQLSDRTLLFDFYSYYDKFNSNKYVLPFCLSDTGLKIGNPFLFDNALKDIEAFVNENLSEEKTKLIFTGSGDLINLPFLTIKNKAGNFLIEDHQISTISSYLNLFASNSSNENNGINGFIAGGFNFDNETSTTALTNELVLRSSEITEALPDKVSALPYAQEEIRNIHKLLETKTNLLTKVEGNDGSKQEIKALLSSSDYDIIHFATHGFFKDIGMDEFNKIPFSSGIFLSNYNTLENKNSGLLTSYDISTLNLENTKLVVLSSCNSGMGSIQKSEGIFGLQRAFKKAGVKNIIVTTKEISDKVAQDFFTKFYSSLTRGQKINESFRLSILNLKESYPIEIWSSFKLLGIGDESIVKKQNYLSFFLGGIGLLILVLFAFKIKK